MPPQRPFDAGAALVARSLGLLAAALAIIGVVRLAQGAILLGLVLLAVAFVAVAGAYSILRAATRRR
ncbi:hypothetical protein [Frigoribacterium salinisoli]